MKSTPTRADFRASFPGAAAIVVERHEAFGWTVFKNVMAPGAVMVTHAAAVVPRELAPNLSMYVRGRATCVAPDGPHDERVPGMFSVEREPHPAGVSRTTALEETEFWCFNWTANRRRLPALTPIRLYRPGDSFELAAGALLLALHGSASGIVGSACHVPRRAARLVATTPFFGFVIAEALP